jgi:hypothetical protein
MILTGLVLVECAILAVNKARCPLTDLATRHTHERVDKFDIYLTLWLARHNKRLLGALFIAAELFILKRWLSSGHQATNSAGIHGSGHVGTIRLRCMA